MLTLARSTQQLWRARSLLRALAWRELQSRYAGSVAGWLWAFWQPVLAMAAYVLVFDVVFALRAGGESGHRLGLYLVVGALPWMAFADTLNRGAASLHESAYLLQKSALAPEMVVARSVLASAGVYTPLLVLMALCYVPVSGVVPALGWLPVLWLLQWLLTACLAHAAAIVSVAVRDAQQVLSFMTNVGIYLSPVLFPITLFPEGWRWLLLANPMTPFVLAYQSILLHGQSPSALAWWGMLGWLVLALVVLSSLMARSRESLVDWL